MKYKDMKRTSWQRVLKRRYQYDMVRFCNQNAMAALLYIDQVQNPLHVSGPLGDVIIADQGFIWLELAIPNEFWWLTVMFDADKKVIQYYFDITDGNKENEDNPYFYDMYLDIVVSKDGYFTIVDQEELENALFYKEITLEQYNRAKKSCRNLENYLSSNMQEVMKECELIYHSLYQKGVQEICNART